MRRTKVKAPDSLKEFVRTEGVGARLSELLELEDRLVPVFVTNPCPEHQADATLTQNNPTSGQKYVVLDTTTNVRIISIMAKCTWSGQPTPLEVWITIDGQTLKHTVTDPVSNTLYYANILAGYVPTDQGLETTDYAGRRTFLYEGRSIKIEVEITGGTVSNLAAKVKYAKW